MKFKLPFAALFSIVLIWAAQGQSVERAEPLSWWTGMKTPLQVMFHGEGIGSADVKADGEGLTVTAIHRADSPDYLFVDVDVAQDAMPGIYDFVFSDGGREWRYSYRIDTRREGSAQRESFGPVDIIYLLMPDRFANGDPSNDSTPDTAEKAGRGNPQGRHGGDIQGMIDRLPYLADLGVTAVWPTPLTLDNEPTYSYHGYACADYYRIDPRFGSNDLYREFVARSHSHGIKVLMDVVTNHCGRAHWWMDNLPFSDWINYSGSTVLTNHAMTGPSDPYASEADMKVHYGGWFDHSMPDMNIENPFMLRYLTQLFIWWIEWADLDGLRVDTYPYNEKHAMAEWAKAIVREYPNINIVGEYWNLSPPLIAYWEGGAQNSDGFDSHLPSVMDFAWNGAVTEALSVDEPGWGQGLARVYNSLAHDFVYRRPENLLIFLDNHDTDRFADLMDGDPRKIKLGLTLLATTRGIPQFYSGTEFMLRSTDMKEGHGGARATIPGAWPGDTADVFDPAGRTPEQEDVFRHASKLFNWRKTEPVIHRGRTLHFLPRENTYAFFRYTGDEAVFVFINAWLSPYTLVWSDYAEILSRYSPNGREVLTGAAVTATGTYEVPARESLVIKFDTAGE